MLQDVIVAPPQLQVERTLATLIQLWWQTHCKNLAKLTRAKIRGITNEFEIFVGHRPITRELLLEWNTHQERRGVSAVRINMKATVLSQFFRWCEHNEFIAKSPDKFFVRHKVPRPPLPAIYTEAEYEMLKERTKGTHNYFLTVIGYRTGMSMVDICYLRWPTIDLEKLSIEALRTKLRRHGSASRFIVPIIANSDLHLLLKDLKANHTIRFGNQNDEYVNPELAGLYSYNQARVTETYSTMLVRAGIKDKTFRNFRNTFISNAANSGMNIGLACKLTGHTNPKIYAQYIRPDLDALRTGLQEAFQWASEKTTVKQLRTPES